MHPNCTIYLESDYSPDTAILVISTRYCLTCVPSILLLISKQFCRYLVQHSISFISLDFFCHHCWISCSVLFISVRFFLSFSLFPFLNVNVYREWLKWVPSLVRYSCSCVYFFFLHTDLLFACRTELHRWVTFGGDGGSGGNFFVFFFFFISVLLISFFFFLLSVSSRNVFILIAQLSSCLSCCNEKCVCVFHLRFSNFNVVAYHDFSSNPFPLSILFSPFCCDRNCCTDTHTHAHNGQLICVQRGGKCFWEKFGCEAVKLIN